MRGKFLLASLFLLLSTACTSLPSVLNPLTDSKGIDATVQLGKENHSTKNKSLAHVDSTVTTTNDNKAGVINQKYESVPPWVLLLIVGLAGIAIPNPFDIPENRRNRKMMEKLLEDKIDGSK